MNYYKRKKKYYTLADFAIHLRLVRESTARAREDKLIREIEAKNSFIDSKYFHRTSKNRKLQLIAEANTIPLRAFGIGNKKQ